MEDSKLADASVSSVKHSIPIADTPSITTQRPELPLPAEGQTNQPVDTSNFPTVDPTAVTIKTQKVVEEFQYLLEKSQQLFAGLRDLPPTGTRQWQPYFQRTFEIYTKLWKFQQINRFILENSFGLKRWEVGEIASKIGQLYYHYYLRTSETNYLHESYIFYEAIRDRQYFKDVLDAKIPSLMIKKMRYYARFIVVCLLLNNDEIVRSLTEELTNLVDDYIKNFKPLDAHEWQLVLQEIGTFMEAENKLMPIDRSTKSVLPVTRRLQIERTSRVDKDGSTKLKLQEAILVGNFQNQIKFSELTLDMFRVLSSLEREPINPKFGSAPNSATDPQSSSSVEKKDDMMGAEDITEKNSSKRVNPHKYLLYRPTLSQLMVYVSTAFKEISENSALLLYLSADGVVRTTKDEDEQVAAGYSGGVATNHRKDKGDLSVVNCLYPGDLVPFTRKALFMIVDSNNSVAFKDFPRVFNQPFLCLLSPTEYPTSIQDITEIGSLFTLFLHAPLLGFSFISDIAEMDKDQWDRCVAYVTKIENRIGEILLQNDSDKHRKRFLQDDFLKQFMVRFVLCSVILGAHSAFKEEKHLPQSHPPLPKEIISSPEIQTMVQELANLAQVQSYYSFSLKTDTISDPEYES